MTQPDQTSPTAEHPNPKRARVDRIVCLAVKGTGQSDGWDGTCAPDAGEKIATEILAAAQAKGEERDREWCEAVGISEQRGPVASGRTLKAREVRRLKAARRAALEEMANEASGMNGSQSMFPHEIERWLRAHADQERDKEEPGGA